MINYLKEGNQLTSTQIFFDKFTSKKRLTLDHRNPILGKSGNLRIKSQEKVIKQIDQSNNNLKPQKKLQTKILRQKTLTLNKKREPELFLDMNQKENMNFFTIKSRSTNFFRIKGLRKSQDICRWDSNKIQSQDCNKKETRNAKAFSYLNSIRSKVKYNFNYNLIPQNYHESTDVFRTRNKNTPNFAQLIVVHCQSLKYIEDKINERYQKIDYKQILKKYRLSLNQFNTDYRNNLFFCILSSDDKLIEYFFWFGVPIKCQQRYIIEDMIKSFLVQIMAQQRQIINFKKANQGKKLMLMDQKGRMSYLDQSLIVQYQIKKGIRQKRKLNERKRTLTQFLKINVEPLV